jgi:hypothetical protein
MEPQLKAPVINLDLSRGRDEMYNLIDQTATQFGRWPSVQEKLSDPQIRELIYLNRQNAINALSNDWLNEQGVVDAFGGLSMGEIEYAANSGKKIELLSALVKQALTALGSQTVPEGRSQYPTHPDEVDGRPLSYEESEAIRKDLEASAAKLLEQ